MDDALPERLVAVAGADGDGMGEALARRGVGLGSAGINAQLGGDVVAELWASDARRGVKASRARPVAIR